ncbi:hypothetical protein TREES_T100009866 [Tupaia chinensis]|uniref:Uncharacterized protein n=1 Tax=Tupaia chinensis TaxID=246437 RepID=L9KPE8_TUPCH|nr:hypothetical protein TREES_T100009866 [Tupaia chinensis]
MKPAVTSGPKPVPPSPLLPDLSIMKEREREREAPLSLEASLSHHILWQQPFQLQALAQKMPPTVIPATLTETASPMPQAGFALRSKLVLAMPQPSHAEQPLLMPLATLDTMEEAAPAVLTAAQAKALSPPQGATNPPTTVTNHTG